MDSYELYDTCRLTVIGLNSLPENQRNTLRGTLEGFCPFWGPPTPQKLESFFFGIFLQL